MMGVYLRAECSARWALRGRGAQMPAAMSRTRAIPPWVAGFPRAVRCRHRGHKRPGAVHPIVWRAWRKVSTRHGRGRLPWAGDREDQAPARRARRATRWPAWVLVPWRRRAPREDALGGSPSSRMRGRGGPHGSGRRVRRCACRLWGHGTPRLEGLDDGGETPALAAAPAMAAWWTSSPTDRGREPRMVDLRVHGGSGLGRCTRRLWRVGRSPAA
jgi:hypothetical protein